MLCGLLVRLNETKCKKRSCYLDKKTFSVWSLWCSPEGQKINDNYKKTFFVRSHLWRGHIYHWSYDLYVTTMRLLCWLVGQQHSARSQRYTVDRLVNTVTARKTPSPDLWSKNVPEQCGKLLTVRVKTVTVRSWHKSHEINDKFNQVTVVTARKTLLSCPELSHTRQWVGRTMNNVQQVNEEESDDGYDSDLFEDAEAAKFSFDLSNFSFI